jgi:hypothetical protein
MTREEAIADIIKNHPTIDTKKEAGKFLDEQEEIRPGITESMGKGIKEFDIPEAVEAIGRAYEPTKDKYGEVGDFVGEEGFLEGIYGDLFNDVESSADTEEDRLRREIRRLNEERSHVFDDEMGYMEASDPLSYHGRKQTRNLGNIREIERKEDRIEELVEALQRGEADMLAGTEQTFDNRDLSLVQGGIEGALPEGLQGGGLQAQVVDPGFEDLGARRAGGFSQQQIMEALQKSQRPQDQGMDMVAAAQERERMLQMQMANRAMPQTLQYGGGQGPGTSYNRQKMYNPWQGNPQSRFQ